MCQDVQSEWPNLLFSAESEHPLARHTPSEAHGHEPENERNSGVSCEPQCFV